MSAHVLRLQAVHVHLALVDLLKLQAAEVLGLQAVCVHVALAELLRLQAVEAEVLATHYSAPAGALVE